MSRTRQTEFPDFDGDFEGIVAQLPTGFADVSWHNDECPSVRKELADGTFLRLWIDYANPLQRDGREYRFSLSKYTADDEWLHHIADADDLNDIIAAINGITAA